MRVYYIREENGLYIVESLSWRNAFGPYKLENAIAIRDILNEPVPEDLL